MEISKELLEKLLSNTQVYDRGRDTSPLIVTNIDDVIKLAEAVHGSDSSVTQSWITKKSEILKQAAEIHARNVGWDDWRDSLVKGQ